MYFIRRTTFRGRQGVAGSSCSRTAGARIDSRGAVVEPCVVEPCRWAAGRRSTAPGRAETVMWWRGCDRPGGHPGRAVVGVPRSTWHRRSVVEGLDEHPRTGRGDIRIVRCGRLPLIRRDSGIHRRLIREVQLGDPVKGLLPPVEDANEPAGLGAPQAGDPVD